MSLQDRKEEAEAVLDSAEMLLETYGRTGEVGRELESKITELERELEDPESEKKIKDLIEDIRQLMEDIQEEPMDEDPMMGPEDEMGGGLGEPEDDLPPF